MTRDLITHYGRVRVANIRAGAIEPDSVFTQRTTYINNFSQEVKMRKRSGLVVTFPVINGRRREINQSTGDYEFIVRHEYTFLRENLPAVAEFLSTVTPEHSLELQEIREAFFHLYQNLNRMQRDIRITYEYYFLQKDIQDVGNIFYHHDLDCVFAYGDGCEIPNHPHSLVGKKEQTENYAQSFQNDRGMVFMIEIVDSLGKHGERFVSICNQVFMITPKRDTRPDGIYVISTKPAHGRIATNEIITEVYEFGEAEERLGLYKNYEHAKTYGDPNLHRKEELEKLQHENKLLQLQMGREKSEFDRLQAELERKNRESEMERESHQRRLKDTEDNLKRLMDLERMRIDEGYHRRSIDRKETSDMVKYLPVILTAIGTVLMAVKAFKPEPAKT